MLSFSPECDQCSWERLLGWYLYQKGLQKTAGERKGGGRGREVGEGRWEKGEREVRKRERKNGREEGEEDGKRERSGERDWGEK